MLREGLRSAFATRLTSVFGAALPLAFFLSLMLSPGAAAAADVVAPTTYTDAPNVAVSPAVIRLAATDDLSGVAATYYRVFPSANPVAQLYTGPITVSDEGTHTLQYWSVDNAGNVEAVKTCWFVVEGSRSPDPVVPVPDNGETDRPVLVLIAGLKSKTSQANPGDPWKFLGTQAAAQKLGAEKVLIVPTRPGATADPNGGLVIDSTGSLNRNMTTLVAWLKQAPLGDSPVIIICHSYGGLITRAMLASDRLPEGRLRNQIDGVIQFGTPNGGSPLGIVSRRTGIDKNDASIDLAEDTAKKWNKENRGYVEIPIWRFGGTYLPQATDVIPWNEQKIGGGPLMLSDNDMILGEAPSDGWVAYRSLENGYGTLPESGYDFGGGGCTQNPYMAHAWDLPGVGKTYTWSPGWFQDPIKFSYEEIVPQNERGGFYYALKNRIRSLAPGAAVTGSDAGSVSGRTHSASVWTAQADESSGSHELPLRQLTVNAGQGTQFIASLDSTTTIVLRSSLDTPTAVVRGPSGSVVECPSVTSVTEDGFQSRTILIGSPTAGQYTVEVRLPSGDGGAVDVTGVAHAGARMHLTTPTDTIVGESAVVTASIEASSGGELIGAILSGSAMSVDSDAEQALVFRDDGLLGDASADDGVYAAVITPTVSGRWTVEASGYHLAADRAAVRIMDVGERTAAVTGSIAETTTPGPGDTLGSFGISVPLEASLDGTYTVSASLSHADGTPVDQLISSQGLAAGEETVVVASLPSERLTCIPEGHLVIGDIRVTREAEGSSVLAGSAQGFTTEGAYSPFDFHAFSISLRGPATNSAGSSSIRFEGGAVNTSSTVSIVEYSTDGGVSWSPAEAADGGFDSQFEDFFIELTRPDSTYGIVVRQTGSDGTVLPAPDWAGARFTIDTVAPSGADGLTVLGAQDARAMNVHASWLTVEAPSDAVSPVAYVVSIDGREITRTFDTELDFVIADPTLAALEVQPVDAAGNHGPVSTYDLKPLLQAPTTLLVSSGSSGSLPFGSTFGIRGTLATATAGLAGQRVVLQSAAPGGEFKDTSLETTTGATGAFSFSVRPTTKSYYRVRFPGAMGLSASGPTTVVYATPRVRLSRSTTWSSLRVNQTYYAKGFVEPMHSSGDSNRVKIRAYKKSSTGSYRYIKSFTASYSYYSSTKSRYRAAIRLTSRGTWKLVAYHAADTNNAATYGSADYVTVR